MDTLLLENGCAPMRLQSIGWHLGVPAKFLRAGDQIVYNFGSLGLVKKVVKETDKTIFIIIESSGKDYEKKYLKTRNVVIKGFNSETLKERL